jgi:hypothetical protein
MLTTTSDTGGAWCLALLSLAAERVPADLDRATRHATPAAARQSLRMASTNVPRHSIQVSIP